MMGSSIKANIDKIKRMDLESSSGLMEGCMKASEEMGSSTGKGYTLIKMELSGLANGRMAKSFIEFCIV